MSIEDRIASDQPDSFAFSKENEAEIKRIIAKYPKGRQASAVMAKRETQRRLDATTPQWPIMHAKLDGIDRDKLMARHKANHVNVVYANNAKSALDAALCRAALARALGIKVHLCGI